MSRSHRFMVLVLILLATASCRRDDRAATERTPDVVRARVETVTPMPLEEFYEAVGTVRSRTTSVLSAKVSGTILALLVREGDRVRAGQLLIRLDDREAQEQVRRAEAGMREAEHAHQEIERAIQAAEVALEAARAQQELAAATFRRYQTLLERQSVSLQEFDEVRARYRVATAEVERAEALLHSLRAKREQVMARLEQARAEAAAARIALSHTRLTAPFAGVITAKSADVGMLATPGLPLLTLEEDAHYRLEVTVPESQRSKIRPADAVRVELDALGRTPVIGRIAEILPAADPTTRSVTVKIELPSSPSLRSGLYGRAFFRIGERRALTIPLTALVERGQLTGVYVLDERDVARFRLITVGKRREARVEVLSGLAPGERILSEVPPTIREGVRVRP